MECREIIILVKDFRATNFISEDLKGQKNGSSIMKRILLLIICTLRIATYYAIYMNDNFLRF